MEDFISISQLNDFIFCPYSIYLHNVYMETDEGLYQATPQVQGTASHNRVDTQTASTKKCVLQSLSVFSEKLGIMGKIDLFNTQEKRLIERKYQLKQIFRGQLYQLWAQYFCLQEMGHDIETIAFYEISTRKTFLQDLPNTADYEELVLFIDKFHNFIPDEAIPINTNKCRHCIYCNLCDKTTVENVYS